MAEIRRGQTGPTEGGKKGAPKGPGNVHNVKNDGTADGALDDSSPRSSKHGRDKSIGR